MILFVEEIIKNLRSLYMSIGEYAQQDDSIAVALRKYAQNVLVVVFGLLPLFFIPTVSAPFDYTKVFVVVAGLLISLVLYSLSVLRSGVISVGVSYPLCALWAVVAISFVSSLLSGDFKDSLVGDLFSIHSTVFVALLALIPSTWLLLKSSKTAVMHMYMLLAVSTIILVLFHVLRLVFGAGFLSFDLFTSSVSSPVGSWNDLALFLGLTVILSLIALEQLSLTKVGRGLFIAVTVASLLMLGVINFFTVWLVLGLTSLVMIVYSLGKDRFTGNQPSFITQKSSVNGSSLIIVLVVFAVSVLFVVGGSTFGGLISKYTGVSYVEVRPSLEATADIARNVYHENAFLGTGPNKFTDAWRLYKDNSINLTPFWNTDFNAGNGYITTAFVTTGVFGGIAWVVFFILFILTGARRLLSVSESDKVWYFISISSFVGALYIWGMSIVYVPGVVVLLLGALCTGVSLSAFSALGGGVPAKVIVVGANRRTGFVLTLAVIVMIISSVSVLYVTGRHYSSVYTFNESLLAVQQGTGIDELEKQVSDAYNLSSSDIFARRIAEYQLSRMNTIASIEAPTEEDLKQFVRARDTGIQAAQLAIQTDPQEPANWAILGGIYGVLASLNIEGALERSLENLGKARELNPKNPLPYLESAIVEGRAGNFDQSRSYIGQAIGLKPDFTEAFFFLSQLEIATGNVDAAVKSTQAIITLEPQNPARYYQLGVLESSRGKLAEAATAFEKAVALDQNYANARYLLALTYDALGKSTEAKAQLEVVLNLNPGNEEVMNLINVITNEGSLKRLRESAVRTNQIIDESSPVTGENGTVSATQETDTSLVTPVNTAPKVEETTGSSAQ
ncbi:MAG: tetratricopeptide repeat protein [Candidatus Kaiserbacteria bacterium]|nr:tetratricopeptide repeat protein [Candidatus Kaiserbacteria bacterium]